MSVQKNGLPTIQAQLSAPVQPALDQGEGSRVEPRRALLPALAAQDIHGARLPVEVFREEGQDLAEPEPSPPAEGDHRSVADAGGGPVPT